jgi:hypothetical protein
MALCIHRLSVPILVNHKPIGNEAAVKNIGIEGGMCEGFTRVSLRRACHNAV